ncbi:MAG: protein kinase [Leptospiraceae bacterium]|nr:protein kinase [Leptospiraceae bacterium]
MKCFYCGFENQEAAKFCAQCGNSLQTNTGGMRPDSDVESLNQHLSPKFTVEKKIGKGGMATVYLGEQTALQRKIVVKFLNTDIASDEEIRERFLLEARTPARLKHPNLVEVIDVGICDDRPYYIMEYASGGSLSDKLKEYKEKNQQFPFKAAIEIIVKVLGALHYCHQNRLQSHRDIKPANIMFRENGEPIIVDFGIVKLEDASITRTRMTMGTANYMSPEQCQGRKDIDGRSDVYSVGIMLFELLSGELPFKGESGLSIMIKQVKEKLPSLNGKIKGKFDRTDSDYTKVADKIEKIIDRACAKNRKKRYETAQEFAMELGALIGTKVNLTPTYTNALQNTWGLVFAFLFLGLGIGGFLGYRFLTQKVAPNNLIIDSIPQGAMVTNVNTNKQEGVTPNPFTIQEPGKLNFKLTLEGYQERLVTVEITDVSKPKTERFELKKEEKLVEPIPENNPSIRNGFISAGGFIWQSSDVKRMNWYAALTYCKNIGMRLPTKAELKIGYDTKNQLLQKPCCEYWSSTPHEDDSDNAYNVHMGKFESFYSSKSNAFYVRCVSK